MNYKLLTIEKMQGPCDNVPHYELSAVVENIGEVVVVSRDFEYADEQPTMRKDSEWYIQRFGDMRHIHIREKGPIKLDRDLWNSSSLQALSKDGRFDMFVGIAKAMVAKQRKAIAINMD